MRRTKTIPGHNGAYTINDLGIIYSEETDKRKKYYKRKISTRIRQGYIVVRLGKGLKSAKQYAVHRLLAQLFIPNPHNLPFVNHKNGIKTDNRLINLEWITPLQNNIHYEKTIKNNKNLVRSKGMVWHNYKNKTIIKKDRELREFESMSAAARFLGVTISAIKGANKIGGKCKGWGIFLQAEYI